MNIPVFNASDEAMNKQRSAHFAEVYPWRKLEVGKCFVIDIDPSNRNQFSNLRNYAYRVGKRLKKKFRVIEHTEAGKIEVACIALVEQVTDMSQAQAKANFWQDKEQERKDKEDEAGRQR